MMSLFRTNGMSMLHAFTSLSVADDDNSHDGDGDGDIDGMSVKTMVSAICILKIEMLAVVLQVNVKSYANTNQLAILPEERIRRLEWNRRYYSVLGVENRRLYELRLQLPEKLVDAEQEELRVVLDSFQLITVDPALS